MHRRVSAARAPVALPAGRVNRQRSPAALCAPVSTSEDALMLTPPELSELLDNIVLRTTICVARLACPA